MHTYFFGVPFGYDYAYQPGEEYANEALSRALGLEVIFICNSTDDNFFYGDIYGIRFDTSEELLAEILKIPFATVDHQQVIKYIKDYNDRYGKKYSLHKFSLIPD